jgi:L-threonylcarbamoyladenylate synthase
MTDFLPDVENCLEVLARGGIILYPTDTVWGLGCDATNYQAVEKLFALKQRPSNKSMVVLVADERDILRHVTQLDLNVFDYLQSVTRPTTVIYEGVVGIADNIVDRNGTIAIRLVNDPFCKHLIKRFRKPVVSTSANISGEPTPGTFMEIPAAIKEGSDYIVTYRQDDTRKASVSTIIKWEKDGSITTIR